MDAEASQGSGRHAAPTANEDGVGRYSRDAYGSSANRDLASDAYIAHTAHRQTRSRLLIAKRVGIVFAALLLVLVVACAWYVHLLDSAMSLGKEEGDAAARLLEGRASDGPYYTLIIGSDTRDESQYEVSANETIEGERADVIMLARIDEQNGKVTLLSIPRDTPWTSESGEITKINEAFSNRGPAGIIEAVEQVSGVNIAHYVQVRFAGFKDLVDALGGIEVDVPVAVSRKDALTKEFIEIEPGRQTLNGQQALIFARARHEYGDDQESKRQSNQRVIIQAIFDSIRNQPFYRLPGVVLEAASCVGTDMSALDVIRLGLSFGGGMKIYGSGAPYKGDFNDALGGVWLCYDDRQGWQNVIAAVDSGEDPSKVSYKGDIAYIAGTDETVVIE